MKFKRLYAVIVILLFGIILYLFWGPLFPWSPVKIGYVEINSSKATVYVNDITQKDSVVYCIDEIIQEIEKFHDLDYQSNFKIIILNKDSNMKRYLPWLKGSGYSVSLSMANLIYIGPTARKSASGIEPYLKHELSHLLIDQNTSSDQALKMHEQGWFVEGVAEYFSGRSFYKKSEFVALARMNNLKFDSLYEKNPLNMSIQELKFHYSYYRFFIEFLAESYGIAKLQEYLKSYIANPDSYKKIFIEVYSMDLDEILKFYKKSLNV